MHILVFFKSNNNLDNFSLDVILKIKSIKSILLSFSRISQENNIKIILVFRATLLNHRTLLPP